MFGVSGACLKTPMSFTLLQHSTVSSSPGFWFKGRIWGLPSGLVCSPPWSGFNPWLRNSSCKPCSTAKKRKKKKLKSDYTYTEYCCNEDNVRLIVFKIFNVENSAAATGLEKVSVHSNPTEGNAKECSNYRTVALISHASKVMLKILQARLQQYMNQELPDVQAGFRKGRGTRDQIANIHWIIKKA